jgi:hypothetical protein
MGRRAPDTVNTIRFELQEHERKVLDSYLTAQSINGYAEAIDKLSSFENLYIIVTVIELLTGKEILPGTPNDVYYIIDAIRNFDFSDTFEGIVGEGIDVAKFINSLFRGEGIPYIPGV